MIYTPAFDALAEGVRERIYRRIRETCAPEIIEILRDTKPGF
jgi:hypothetical protein